MKMTRKDIPQVADLYTDLWDLTKEFYDCENTPEYWDRFNDACAKIWEKHGKDHLSYVMLNAFATYLDRKATDGQTKTANG